MARTETASPDVRAADALAAYVAKRDFSKTREPPAHKPKRRRKSEPPVFVVQKHAATRLHYDFRLEIGGVLVSWAVTKGPSLDPADKRLAVHTEDHPMDYAGFEGTIPKGEYGGGTVMIWDGGTWEPIKDEDPAEQVRKGRLELRLHGQRMCGDWALVRMGGRKPADKGKDNWLLIKMKDDFARPGDGAALVEEYTTSAVTDRPMNVIAEEEGEDSTPATTKRATALARKKAPAKAKKPQQSAEMPDFVKPQLATREEKAPAADGWLHEIKYDGYRLIVRVEDGRARIYTRNGKDWTDRFKTLAATLADLPCTSVMLDGEAVVLDEHGASDFGLLQEALSDKKTDAVVFEVFDCLFLDGEDLRELPLITRKERLKVLMAEADTAGGATVRYSDHIDGAGPRVWEKACSMRLEGVISKRRDRPYRSGRGTDWIKSKCVERQEFVIGGYTLPSKGGQGIGALALGYYDAHGALTYAGKVGTGYTAATSKKLRALLEPRERKTSPFTGGTAGEKDIRFVRPDTVCEIEYAAWTREGVLRHAAFKGLREDKEARDVVLEQPAESPGEAGFVDAVEAEAEPEPEPGPEPKKAPAKGMDKAGAAKDDAAAPTFHGVKISNPDRVIYPQQGLTKRQLAEYMDFVAPRMLPFVKDRPLGLVRCPEGRGEQCFFQRHPGMGLGKSVSGTPVTEKGRTKTHVMVTDEAGLIGLVQSGVMEIHPWGARADDLEHPDVMVIDLDPHESVPFKDVRAAARDVRDRLSDLGLESFVKTTGGKGLHVVVPLPQRRNDWAEVKGFAQALARALAQEEPDRFVAVMTKAKRTGRIFIDYLRNGHGATAVAPYSSRAREGAPVAVPVTWEELSRVPSGDKWTVETLPARLKRQKADPWAGYFDVRQSLTKKAMRALGMKV
ncbi:ATP-dependent DNA ligase [Caenispirillum salinarum AK4]|uniref:DNA ligase (ATP) n=1 Tax=Caenispirillum salinarum AK4 TaxID=1238182 RepID=K9HLT4_9PROT|nr:DNA ligase D [Caenispirillum salinarum]EKV31303.1 ATP-dependent DNA ligase [Caenispirillum salinarum AK4]